MRRRSAAKGPEFVRLFAPLLDTLRELGDSGRPKEVTEKISVRLKLSDEVLNRTNKNGGSRFANQVAWARFYLAKAGLIDTSQRGVWTLTDSGRRSHLDHDTAIRIFRDVHKNFEEDQSEANIPLSEQGETGLPPDERIPGEETFREEMARTLQSLTAEGFERLCQRILREVGFEEVVVTGRSGDGGIDGYGTLRINRLVSDRVLFQCKKHTKQVSPSYIREFRGSMAARAERGIFLATNTFSAECQRRSKSRPLRRSKSRPPPTLLIDTQGTLMGSVAHCRLGYDQGSRISPVSGSTATPVS